MCSKSDNKNRNIPLVKLSSSGQFKFLKNSEMEDLLITKKVQTPSHINIIKSKKIMKFKMKLLRNYILKSE